MPSCDGSLATAIQSVVKLNFRMAVIVLFYILQKCDLNKRCIFFEDPFSTSFQYPMVSHASAAVAAQDTSTVLLILILGNYRGQLWGRLIA